MKKGKRYHCLWSGGLDSTFMIQHLLNLNPNNSVTCSYVEIVNNKAKTKMELEAIDKMVPIFKDLYKQRFDYIGVSYRAEVVTYNKFNPLVQVPIWLAAVISSTPDRTDEVCIGYVMNDCAISYLSDIKNIVKSYRKGMSPTFPKIDFPLTKHNKEMLSDSFNGGLIAELQQHVVWCEMPNIVNGKFEPCGKCVPCSHSPICKYKKWDSLNKKSDFCEVVNSIKEVQLEFDVVKDIGHPLGRVQSISQVGCS